MGTHSDPPDRLRAVAEHYFGDRLDLARRYAELLTTDGVLRGLIGPREADRLWERHLLNSVAVVEVLDSGDTVADVGSGAGLPGVALAIARPDLRVTLVEPQLRRTTFLHQVVASLGLTEVTVLRARAEAAVAEMAPADVVVARAVASLDRLAGWCLPLTVVGGRLLALKGERAAEELARHRTAVVRVGGGDLAVMVCGAGRLDPPTTVVRVVRERVGAPVGGGVGGRVTGRGRRRRTR